MDAVTTGKFIFMLRKDAGMNQKQLSAKLNVTDKAISRWETGKGFPDVQSLLALSAVFNVSVNELLTGERITAETYSEISEKTIVSVIESSEKKNHSIKRLITILSGTVLLLFLAMLFFAFDIPSFISHHAQNGYTVVALTSDSGEIMDCSIEVTHDDEAVGVQKNGDGYCYKSGYGEYKGTATVFPSENMSASNIQFEFGFVNTNNWHIVNIGLELVVSGNQVTVKQTISYLSDGQTVVVLTSQDSGSITDGSVSVFTDGIK